MCGIAGILSTERLPEPVVGRLPAMLQSLRHRGPDDAGTYRSPGGQAALAHARLSILDLSPAGHQPMSTPDGRF
ncbi:MAG: asparagine synthetase B, partial [Acidobacteria bacterium]|nr:asparagine synthetase B [Acidobacteriota bacterium]